MESIEYFTETMQENYINRLKERLIKSCIEFNPKVTDFVFDYDIKNNYIFCLLTCNTNSKVMPVMYRMLTVNAFQFQDIYFDGNVCSGYTLNDVKQRTKQYVNSISKDINEII